MGILYGGTIWMGTLWGRYEDTMGDAMGTQRGIMGDSDLGMRVWVCVCRIFGVSLRAVL